MKKAAIIGMGTISAIHLAAITANPEITLCAVCDTAPAAKATAPEGIPFYTDYKELAAKAKPDCVHICLPHWLHYPVSKWFAEQGIHVFCEKPVAMNTAQAREFAALEAAHPEVHLGICLQNRRNETTERLKALLDSGVYGKITGCIGLVPWQRTKAYYEAQPWRGQLGYAGGGCMINQSVHTLDLLYYLCGKIATLHGTTAQLLDYGIEVEDTVSAQLHYAAGFDGLFWATNANCCNGSVRIEVSTEKAHFRIENNCLYRTLAGQSEEKLCEDDKMPGAKFYYGASHAKLIAEFYRALENNTQNYLHVHEAVMSIRLIDAIQLSDRTGAPAQV